jgi:hypothetical protein
MARSVRLPLTVAKPIDVPWTQCLSRRTAASLSEIHPDNSAHAAGRLARRRRQIAAIRLKARSECGSGTVEVDGECGQLARGARLVTTATSLSDGLVT